MGTVEVVREKTQHITRWVAPAVGTAKTRSHFFRVLDTQSVNQTSCRHSTLTT